MECVCIREPFAGSGEDFDVFVVWNIVFFFVFASLCFHLVVWKMVFMFVFVFKPGDNREATAGGGEDASVTEGWGQVTHSGHHSVLQDEH